MLAEDCLLVGRVQESVKKKNRKHLYAKNCFCAK